VNPTQDNAAEGARGRQGRLASQLGRVAAFSVDNVNKARWTRAEDAPRDLPACAPHSQTYE